MRMIESYKDVMRNYANFDGRAGRPEFWWFTLAHIIIQVGIVSVLIWSEEAIGEDLLSALVFILFTIYWLATVIPSFAVTVRRLHDTGRSAWWLLIGFIPYIGGLILLIPLVNKTYPMPNQYGEPAGWDPDNIRL